MYGLQSTLETHIMADDEIKPKPGRPRDTSQTRLPSLKQQVLRQAGKAGMRGNWSMSHIKPAQLSRGMGVGLRARAGNVAPGSRRVIVKVRYTRIAGGDLGAARAHLTYIQRDGVTREGNPGQLYDANRDRADGSAFLDRSADDPHQFRFMVSAEDSARLADLKPFVRDLMAQMERDLGTKLDWVAVDHFNTGHPHSHIVIRGKDDLGKDLVMARDYIGHAVRARAQGLITFELGPETQIERMQKLRAEMDQERLTTLDRSILAKSRNGVLVLTAYAERDKAQHTLRIGRLRTLQRLGLASERQTGVWQLDRRMDVKLQQLGERADKFKMMQRALREAGIDRAAAALALFEKAPRKTPLIGNIVGVGLVDEIADRSWVIVDAVDGRFHYAELGRLKPTPCRSAACWSPWRAAM
jgi:type IV secretory pathway VirD2 relaxase